MPQKSEGVDMDTLETDYSRVLEESEQVLRQCFKEYSLDELFLSFNGGKDCTVLLDIVIEILKEIHHNDDIGADLNVVYIRTNNPFREMEDFVYDTEIHYGIKLTVVEGEMKETLKQILEKDKKLKVCLMGTRRTDPYSDSLNFMQKTDANWPQIIRVSPLLNWDYHQIWSYIKSRNVPYCSLYNTGYTSIGSTLNTRPNPALVCPDKPNHYQPAWKLIDASLERAGRIKPSTTTACKHNGVTPEPSTTTACKHNGLTPETVPNKNGGLV